MQDTVADLRFTPAAHRAVPGRQPARPPSFARRAPSRSIAADKPVQALLREYAETRDPAVRERLVAAHDRMVRYLASRFGLGAGTTAEDLVQVGYIGLLSAIDRYDP